MPGATTVCVLPSPASPRTPRWPGSRGTPPPTHAGAVGIARDLPDAAHRAAIARAAAKLGPVSLVVNNASTLGASPLPSLSEVDADVMRRVFDVNVVAPLALVQALSAHLAPGAT